MKKLFFALSLLSSTAFAQDYKISDQVIPLQTENFPDRPSPILELGDPLLKSGKIRKGYKIPTGAVWQPSFIVWGDLRTAVQTIDSNLEKSGQRLTEASTRFDLFGNLSLTSTERILIGFRPLDQQDRFTRYTFESPNEADEDHFEEEYNFDFTTLFFEGDFGEIFPGLDKKDKHGLDYAFSVGRQQITWQDGMLINDRIDSIGISKINLKPDWAVNYRTTLLWAWNELNRKNLAFDDRDSSLFGWSNEIDFKETTTDFDFVFVDGDEETQDGLFAGVGFNQRLYSINTTFRLLGSHALDEETEHSSDGALFFTELSKDLKRSHDFLYLNAFWGIDKFRSASRAPEFAGPLGGTGVLFAAVGLGRYGAPLNNQPDDAIGSAMGYQIFFNQRRQNILLELAGRYALEDLGQRAVATGISFQTAVGRRNILRLDTYTRYGKNRADLTMPEDEKLGFGARIEWQLRL